MQPEIIKLLADVEVYLARTGMAASTFGRKATNDSKIIDRLKGGGQLFPATANRIREYMKANRPPRVRRKQA